jgi:hypothetical protein
MVRPTIDLSAYITEEVPRESPLFPVELHPLYLKAGTQLVEVQQRQAVVRGDSGKVIGVVAGWSHLVVHQAILATIEVAARRLDTGPVRQATYLDRSGARMRVLITFPGLAEPVRETDRVCPCIMVQNTYGWRRRILVYLGAFRFACGNLAVGGGGVFSEGYMRVPAGEIPVDQLEQHFERCLSAFWPIVRTYRIWADRAVDLQGVELALEGLPVAIKARIWRRINKEGVCTVYDAYQAALHLATHEMRTFGKAFDLLEHVNAGFQRVFRSR